MLGTSVGNYQVASLIGTGGMGAVYLAKHSMLGRPAAVKVLLPEMSQKREVVTRFFNEARAATAIRHPGIVEIYDFGFLPDNSAYIIMELLEGETLGRRLHQVRRVSVARALLMTRQIASALQAAHAQQIVHRDLKPDNLFIVRDPESGGERIKLLDFGIAKLASDSSEQMHTRTGTVMGTPRYMSPEQCRGAGACPIDARSDLYSLGCILYQMMCGRPPFIADGDGDVIAHHLYFPPKSPTHYQPDVPPAVEKLLLSLLHKDPEARPASASEVITRIDALGPLDAYAAEPVPLPVAEGSQTGSAPIIIQGTTLSGSASAVEVPAAPQTVSLKGPVGKKAPERSLRKLWWGAGVALVAAALAAVLAMRATGQTTTPTKGAEPPAPAPTPPTVPSPMAPRKVAVTPPATGSGATPTPGEPTAPAGTSVPAIPTVLLQFMVRPEGTPYRIFIGEAPLEGTEVEVPKSRIEKVEIKVVAKGYRPYSMRLLPTADQVLAIDLIPEKRATPRGAASSKQTTPAATPGARVERVNEL